MVLLHRSVSSKLFYRYSMSWFSSKSIKLAQYVLGSLGVESGGQCGKAEVMKAVSCAGPVMCGGVS